MPFIQRKTLGRIILAVVFAIVAVAAVVWFYRDLPRRRVERALAERLGAEVRLGRLEIGGTRRVVLHDLLVSRIAGKPWLDTVRIGEVVATGSLTEMTNGVFETLRLVDVEARLATRQTEPPAETAGEASHVVAERLDIERGALVAPAVASGGPDGSTAGAGAGIGNDAEGTAGESRLEGEAHLTDVGGRLAGEVRLSSSAPVRLGPWRAVFLGVPAEAPGAGSLGGGVEGLSATLTIDEGGNRNRIEARGRRLILERAGRSVVSDDPGISIEISQDEPAKPMHVELRPRAAALFGEASVSIDLEPGTQDPVAGRVQVRAAALGPLLVLAGPTPFGAGTDGDADLDVRITGRNRAEYELEARLKNAIVDEGPLSARLERATMRAKGTALLDQQAPGLTVAADLDLPAGTGTWEGRSLPPDVLPARASLEGSISLGGDIPRFDGRIAVDTAGAGRFDARGSAIVPGTTRSESAAPVPEPSGGSATRSESTEHTSVAELDVRWGWSHPDLPRLARLARVLGAAIPETLEASGRAAAEGTLTGPIAAPVLHATVSLDPLEASYVWPPPASDESRPDRPVPVTPPGEPGIQDDPARSGTATPRVEPRSQDGSARRVRLTAGRARAEIAWSVGRSPIRVRSLQVAGRAAVPPLDAFDGSLTASGQIDPSTGRAAIDAAVLDAPGLAHVTAKATADLGALAQAMASGVQAEPSSPGHHGTPAAASAGQPVPNTLADSASVASLGASAATFTTTVDQIDLARWRTFLHPLIGEIAPGFDVKGSGQAAFSGSVERDGRWKSTGTATIAKSGFSSADGAQVLEGLDTSWDIEVGRSAADRPVHLEARAIAGGFQLLWGSFFADAAKLGSTVELSATLFDAPAVGPAMADAAAGGRNLLPPAGAGVAAPARAWSVRVAWAYPGGPRVDASIETDPTGAISYAATAVVEDVATTVERYVRGPLGDSVPFLAKVEAGGAMRAEAEGRIDGARRTLRGRVEARGLRVAGTKGFAEVNGLDLDLPIALAWDVPAGAGTSDAGTSDAPGDPGSGGSFAAVRPLDERTLSGNLRFQSASIGDLDIDAVETPLSVRGDTVRLHEGLAVPLFGGVLVLEDLSLNELLRSSRHLETGVVLSHLGVGELTKAFALPPMQGEIEGSFQKVVLTPAALRVEGKSEIAIFGGTVRLGDISGQEILSRYPKLTFSADFEEIDLGKVTQTFDFGEVTGIVRGYVHDCELFRDVPVRFEALLETVKKSGIPRRINVKAINNIAILGTGGNPGLLDRGLHKFLDNYTYDRIGIGMSLRDDAFLIRGLIHEGEKELFLKGRFPFPINIINAQPGMVVSFSAMVDRLKALDVTTVKTSRSGP